MYENYKRRYDVGYMKKASDYPDDYETVEFESATNYRDAVKRARKISTGTPYQHGANTIVAAEVVCYCRVPGVTEYWNIYSEVFVDGKKVRKIEY